MADTKKLKQAANIAGGIGGVGLSWLGSYFNTPKATGNEGYLHDANVVGNWNFGRTDMQGLLSQYDSMPALNNVTGKDFFNPSSGEIFGSLFGAGATSYGAMSGLTSSLKGKLGSNQMGSKSVTAPGTTSSNVDTELMQNAKTREEQFDIAEGAFQNMGLGKTGKTLSVAAANQGQSATSPDYSDLFPTGAPYAQPNQFMVGQRFGCGGHKYGCGGHKYANGGPSFNWGDAIGEGINLASAGIGIGLNYLGIQDQIRKSEMNAAEVNAANAYARQLMEHNFNQAVADTKNNMFNQQALQMMAMGGDLQTQGADFPLYGDFNVIGAGGTHEQNPFGGVFQGMAMDGRPNLVEEDEVVWNDYVFSNRIKIPVSIADTYKLREGITYAEAAKKLSKESEERPNDPISQNGLTAALDDLMQSQENIKAKRDAARAKRAIAKMSPEEVLQMLSAVDAGAPVPTMFREGGYRSTQAQKTADLWEKVNNYGVANLTKKEIRTLRNSTKKYPNADYPDIDRILSGRSINLGVTEDGLNDIFLDINGLNFVPNTNRKQVRFAEDSSIPSVSPSTVDDAPLIPTTDTFNLGGHMFDGKSTSTGKMNKASKKAAQDKAERERGLYKSGVGHLNSEWLKYIASQIDGFNANDYNYTGADTDIRQFILDNYDKLGGWEGLNKAFRQGSRMPLLAENSPLRNYKYTEVENYSMTPEQWNTFFGSLNAYKESRKAGNTSGKYHADSKFDNSGKTAAQVEQDPRYKAFKTYVREQAVKYANGEQADDNALRYLQTLDEGINTSKGAQRLLEYNPDGSVKMVDGRMQLRQGWESDYDKRNFDQIGGIYHFYTDTPDITKSKTGERHIVRLNGEEIEITPEEMAKIGRFTHGDNYISQVIEKDSDGNDVITNYYDYQSPEVEAEYNPSIDPGKEPPLPTWMRYAPLLSGLGMLQGPAKDYSTGVSPRQATYVPIGDYLPYLPVDTQRYINAENQQAAAQLNAIMNASAGNRNMAMAQAALANQQRQQGIGQRMQAAEQINWDRLRQAGEFNRGTNMFNAQAHNQAEIANLQNNPLLLRQAQHNQMMRYQADRDRDAAISASANAFLDSLSGIGRENLAWNQANSNEALRYSSRPNGYSGYKTPTLSDEDIAALREVLGNQKNSKQPGNKEVIKAFGGCLKSKPNKKNRR